MKISKETKDLLGYAGFSFVFISFLSYIKYDINPGIIIAVVAATPKFIDWIDTFLSKKDVQIAEMQEKATKKDAEQDILLQKTLTLSQRTEIAVDQVSKYQEIFDLLNRLQRQITQNNNKIEKLARGVRENRDFIENFKKDFAKAFVSKEGREWVWKSSLKENLDITQTTSDD